MGDDEVFLNFLDRPAEGAMKFFGENGAYNTKSFAQNKLLRSFHRGGCGLQGGGSSP
ncbi:hypothetical protein VCRA2120O248_410005 [Vibrio crassostreae]|nr:hypothetical protein VCRA2120O248_410005 [Vibrio crassostreae]